jgi:L-alanine-DL-glutamate epimerase-like enolase superfamily enzyme
VAAPLSIAHTHVHSIRTGSGSEALVARVLTRDGAEGFGFTLNLDATAARDMAAWDAFGREKGVPLHVLLGGSYRKTITVAKDELPAIAPDWTDLRKAILDNRYELLRLDPFAWGSVEAVQAVAAAAAAFDLGIALLAPNAHPWELQYCAALAATIRGEDTKIIVRSGLPLASVAVPEFPGLGIDWSLESAFKAITWQSPA